MRLSVDHNGIGWVEFKEFLKVLPRGGEVKEYIIQKR